MSKKTTKDEKKPAKAGTPTAPTVKNPATVLDSLLAHYEAKQEAEPDNIRWINAAHALRQCVGKLDDAD